ncbi:hypothetical protein ABZ820_27875 [Streptomyces diacarni]|uniref:hypothetical protein n=1 Tax=Streptomyces diacarni TaxID=2800381 RepID=UPI0033D70B34
MLTSHQFASWGDWRSPRSSAGRAIVSPVARRRTPERSAPLRAGAPAQVSSRLRGPLHQR